MDTISNRMQVEGTPASDSLKDTTYYKCKALTDTYMDGMRELVRTETDVSELLNVQQLIEDVNQNINKDLRNTIGNLVTEIASMKAKAVKYDRMVQAMQD